MGTTYRTTGGKNGGEAPELWGREFGDHRDEELALTDGTQIKVGQSFREPGFYVEGGKVRTRNGYRSTAGYYFVPALDALDFGRVEHDPHSSTVFVEGPDGVFSAYDYASEAAADEIGSDDLTHGMAAALMVGEFERARVALDCGAHDLLQLQYLEVFEAYRSEATLANLIRATDGNYALLKNRGGDLVFGDEALTIRTADFAEARRAGAGAVVVGALGDLLVDLDAGEGFTAEHEKLARVAELVPFGEDPGEVGRAFVPAPDPAFVLTDAAALVAEEIAFSRSIGNRSYQVIGEPSAGKNYLLRQMSAVEGRPHVEIDANGDTDVNELLGAPTMREGSMKFLTGRVTAALERGWRVVLNEANAVDRELLTALHNVVGSGNSLEDRVVVVASPEASPDRTVIPVHEDADLVFTFNPEGTADARRLPRALASRMPCRVMGAPSVEDAGRVIAAQANRMLSRRDPSGAVRVDDAAARAAWEFYRQLRACAADPSTSQGFERAPDARWVHRFAAEQAVRGVRALSLAEEIYDHDADAEEDRRVARETVRDLYSRCYGSADLGSGRRAA